MADAYKLLKYMIYGAVFENIMQSRRVCTKAEIENYAEQSFDAVLSYLRTRNTSGSFSDFQCNISIEASRIFRTNKYGQVEYKKSDIGNIA